MKRYILLNCMLMLTSFMGIAQKKEVDNRIQPALVVGIVVDQMRADYIYRYYDNLTAGGFKLLLSEGFECSNTQYNYMPTYTGPGHASIYTGTTPCVHGITGNNWIEGNSMVYCVSDTSAEAIGASGTAGAMSPYRLLTTTVGDELRLFSNFTSRVVGISLKDRGAILPAGHSGMAYWFDNASNNFITSSYYAGKGGKLPGWLNAFNSRKLPEKYLNGIWKPLYELERYKQSTADNNEFENVLDASPDAMPVFNYDLGRIRSGDADLLRRTPFGNTITKELAVAAIEGELLGADSICDMLLVSFSSTDYVGHAFGTNAIETEDTYLRLDRDLADFISYRDKKIGRNNYLLFLTADHGAMPNPLFLKSNRIPAGYIYNLQIEKTIKQFLAKQYNDTTLFGFYLNDQVWINSERVRAAGIDRQAVLNGIAAELASLDYVADVVISDDLLKTEYTSGMKSMVQKGFNRKRSGDLSIIFQPGYIESYGLRRPMAGTTHGSPYRYDTQVPLYWMGWKIRHGNTWRQTDITDIAATLSALLHICQPSGCTGHPVTELLK